MVRPNKTNTSEMLMVDVIFAFTNRAVDIFFFFDIKKGYTKKNPIALNKKNGFFQIGCKVTKILRKLEIYSGNNQQERLIFQNLVVAAHFIYNFPDSYRLSYHRLLYDAAPDKGCRN